MYQELVALATLIYYFMQTTPVGYMAMQELFS